MSYLIKKSRSRYYARITIRVGNRKDNKKKCVYVKLDTDRYAFAKKRNAIVTLEENKIRQEIRNGDATKSDLLNINNNIEWEWLKANGITSLKIHTLSEYADKFIKYKAIKGMRPSTLDGYRYSLNKFISAVGSRVLVSDIRQDHIDDFIEHLEKDELAQASIDSNLKSISVFLKWCELRNYIEKTPIIEYFRPIIDDKWLTESEYNSIIEFDDYKLDDVTMPTKRYSMVFKLYGETGMRLSEGFYGVLTEDENGIWLAIPNEHSKSKKGRTIELNEEQRDAVQMMQSIWYSKGATKQHIKYYSRMFKKVCNKLGIENKSFHSLRHMFGKRMVTITGNIYKVSGLLGHSSVKVTEDSYVKGFDRKSTLRDFPSLRKYLITTKTTQKQGGETHIGKHFSNNEEDSSSLNYS